MKQVVLMLAVVLLSAGLAFGRSGEEIVSRSGVKGGLVVHVGCGDGKLTARLRINDSYIVQGLDSNKLTAVSFGENQPVASNDDWELRAQNRRIEIRLRPAE